MESSLIKTIRGNWVILTCLAIAAVLLVLVLAELVGSLTDTAQARQDLAGAFHQNAKDPNDTQGAVAAAKKNADALKKKNLFAKEPPKQHPIKQVDGILGSEALIQNKWYKAGDKVGDAKIISISATGLVAEWDGKKKTFSPIAAVSEAKEPSKPPEPNKAKAAEPNKPGKKAEVVEVKATTPKVDDPLAFIGRPLSEKLRGMLLQKWNSMSEEEKQKATEEWNKMSDEQKQQAITALEGMDKFPD